MLRNPDLSWPALAGFSRSMARLLEAGVEIRKSLQTSAKQSGDKRLAPAVERLKSGISGGASLAEAVRSQQPLFPELYCALVDVGEQTGHLPEVFESLAKYYEDRLLMQRDFRSSAAWPVIQLIAAIGII
ncbi:MAG: type II secretion system F family protein, partial [Planctomyces sp.]